MPDLSHLWQRFLLASALVVGLLIGVATTVFGYSNLGTVNVHWSVFHIDSVPLWMVAVVPIALLLVTGTLYHWMDGLHHFTEHHRHRRRVHELEVEVATLRAHLDQVLEMPDHSGVVVKAKAPMKVALPAAEIEQADDAMAGLDMAEEPPAAPPAKPDNGVEPKSDAPKHAHERRKRSRVALEPASISDASTEKPAADHANGVESEPATAAREV
jgi:hypothetical protein